MRGVVHEPRCEAVSFSRRVSGSDGATKRFNIKPLQDFDSLEKDGGRLRPDKLDVTISLSMLYNAAPRMFLLFD
jgi:hypothetical protein